MAKNKAKKVSKADSEKAKLEKAEKRLIEKYGDRIVPDSIRRAPKGRYSGKLLVTIRTKGVDGKYDGNTREVATSDVHQVHHTDDVKKELDKQKAKEARTKAATAK